MSRHLVLGSSGLIGKAVCRHLFASGEEVLKWDVAAGPEYDLADPGNYKNLEEIMWRCDYVHYLASNVGGSKYLSSSQSEYDFIANNSLMMEFVFLALRSTEKPFYFASSQMATMFHSVYGRLKAVGEAYTKALGGNVVRFWNVYGWEPPSERSHVIPDLVHQGLNDGRILCQTSGSELRQFMLDADAAVVLGRLSEQHKDFTDFEFVPVTSGRWISVRELARTIGKILDVPVYFGDRGDDVQGARNEPPPMWSFTSLYAGTNAAGGYGRPLTEGLKEVIAKAKA